METYITRVNEQRTKNLSDITAKRNNKRLKQKANFKKEQYKSSLNKAISLQLPKNS